MVRVAASDLLLGDVRDTNEDAGEVELISEELNSPSRKPGGDHQVRAEEGKILFTLYTKHGSLDDHLSDEDEASAPAEQAQCGRHTSPTESLRGGLLIETW